MYKYVWDRRRAWKSAVPLRFHHWNHFLHHQLLAERDTCSLQGQVERVVVHPNRVEIETRLKMNGVANEEGKDAPADRTIVVPAERTSGGAACRSSEGQKDGW